ncbi:MAG: flagellar motor protein [Gammaproteobacteria bacterium]|nr:flagellar motor protein [Gammaproteobacteria bacterium]
MDIVAIVGVCIAFAAVVGGNFLEGGQIAALVNTPAGVIVIGGTLGAVVLQTPGARLKRAVQVLRWVFVPPKEPMRDGIEKMMTFSNTARREGLLGLENLLEREADGFVRKGLELLIDGGEPQVIRHALENELAARTQRDLAAAQVFRSMGGYAPTIGIIGAVMGLIQVMGNLADPSALGAGIATAFVATIYGVGLANLLFLPIADRIAAVVDRQSVFASMTIEGILAIAEGEHPRSIELRLRGFEEHAQ